MMTAQEKIQRGYMISLRQVDDAEATYQVAYVPRGLQQVRASGSAAKRVPEFKAIARVEDDDIVVNWQKSPTDSDATQEDFDQDVRARVRPMHEWIERLMPLVSSVGAWAKELDWAVRQVDKPMSDSEIGDYRAPGLVLQQDTVRVGLEPIGRSAPGTEGVVDLYLLPAYDDIGSFYYYNSRWNLHYMAPGSPAVVTIRDAAGRPLSKKALREVLDEMKKNVE
ncbi:MAG TPA: hypothetical protein VG013_06695 [Gemmataceae bacterium]|nr:hypothetical protein [Gemmataceae bacterium]